MGTLKVVRLLRIVCCSHIRNSPSISRFVGCASLRVKRHGLAILTLE